MTGQNIRVSSRLVQFGIASTVVTAKPRRAASSRPGIPSFSEGPRRYGAAGHDLRRRPRGNPGGWGVRVLREGLCRPEMAIDFEEEAQPIALRGEFVDGDVTPIPGCPGRDRRGPGGGAGRIENLHTTGLKSVIRDLPKLARKFAIISARAVAGIIPPPPSPCGYG